MQSEIDTGIVVVTYNNSALLKRQIELLKRFCKDRFEIVIVDNSTEEEEAQKILYYASEAETLYMKTNASSKNGSSSHAFAANLSYLKLKDSYEYLFYLDHDCFPVKEFSVKEILSEKYLFAGIGQGKAKKYLWPGCFMFNNSKIQKELIDFSPNGEYRLDTGGNIYKCIDSYPEAILYFNEVHEQNPEFNKSFYNFYSMINGEMFMHFINGSDWAKSKSNQERINSLLNILQKKVEKK